ncbi:MAG: DUF4065 domain-containing protein [Waddliaceae bacterium]|nr:DUF4065 domain-containing protein [Waddliaceae bacterium]MBT3578946.1 DUF4065 domain-containing protein [Waddliaceae bacterium]MBT6928986.1 DUF4065 domain-containing protein [Waddliaceae bacterium]MBT7263984.1 DUF4065 domain-containing protein [Waddliaceae bacterium]MBT7461572.1 DUF4065 domain-containing protein [Waddliaceae bacterium]
MNKQCLKCDSTDFKKKNIRFTPEIKGETVEVIAPAYICKHCHTPLMDSEQIDRLRKETSDAYRKNHDLLSSAEIIHYRNILGMSQKAFAAYLRVGEASVKRWETFFIQDASQDELIRLKCDQQRAEDNSLNVHWINQQPDIYSGNEKFNFERFKNILLIIVQKINTSKIFLNKVLFYIDFGHFKKYGKSITGTRYVPLQYGPCPDNYQAIFQHFVDQGVLKSLKGHRFHANIEPDMGLFDDQEKETVNAVCKLCKEDNGKKLFDLSHQEKGFKETPDFQFISYEYARDLNVTI